ncbi:hypothetical protein NDU88_008803 [Pleurodeles waltl]|uniref:Uncharacterized protein n=1 Tax=Pleurodeles waltl TaxID=8319 RepID=A0AAV7PTZ1_PLEWA|nr:hypothetical protein NDU88_008803 [Pleurodeles waltl]
MTRTTLGIRLGGFPILCRSTMVTRRDQLPWEPGYPGSRGDEKEQQTMRGWRVRGRRHRRRRERRKEKKTGARTKTTERGTKEV